MKIIGKMTIALAITITGCTNQKIEYPVTQMIISEP